MSKVFFVTHAICRSSCIAHCLWEYEAVVDLGDGILIGRHNRKHRVWEIYLMAFREAALHLRYILCFCTQWAMGFVSNLFILELMNDKNSINHINQTKKLKCAIILLSFHNCSGYMGSLMKSAKGWELNFRRVHCIHSNWLLNARRFLLL